MAVIPVYVPICGNVPEYKGWLYDVSQHIDNGDDVEFFDANDHAKKVSVSILHLDADGVVCVWGSHETISEAKTVTFLGGYNHTMPGIHGIRADDTDTSIGIKVKI